jgi:hypothetical protein
MGLFNFIETIFFFSLAITFLLILLLVYHFKQRINTIEQRSDTMFEIINGVVKEITNIKKIVMLQSQLLRPSAIFPQHNILNNHSSSHLSPVPEENDSVNDYEIDDNDDNNDNDESDDEEPDNRPIRPIQQIKGYNRHHSEVDEIMSVSDDDNDAVMNAEDDEATHKTIDLNHISKENEIMFHSIPMKMTGLGEGHYAFENSFVEIIMTNQNYHYEHKSQDNSIGKDDRVEELVDVNQLPDENIMCDIEEIKEQNETFTSLENPSHYSVEELTIDDFEPIDIQYTPTIIEENNTLEENNVVETTDITTTHVPETIQVNKLNETIEVPSIVMESSAQSETAVHSNREMYDKMTVQQLKALTITRGIATDVKKMRKSELIELLLQEE